MNETQVILCVCALIFFAFIIPISIAIKEMHSKSKYSIEDIERELEHYHTLVFNKDHKVDEYASDMYDFWFGEYKKYQKYNVRNRKNKTDNSTQSNKQKKDKEEKNEE